MIHKKLSFALSLILSGILICGCSDDTKLLPESLSEKRNDSGTVSGSFSKKENAAPSESSAPARDNTPKVLTPEASGTVTAGNDFVHIDASHTDEGYFMVQYLGSNQKVKLRVAGPGQSEDYIYLLSGSKEYETFPLPCGNGVYQIQILENAGGDMYAVAYSTEFEVAVKNEFGPFLYPNQYVNFTSASQTVAKGSELAKGTYSDLEAIENIYQYVTSEITYDEAKASSVSYGYLPDIDETIASGKGICFDYAAVMSAMLRTQGIPTKLEVGYSGDAYHAWISAYVTESGWVDGIIQFDGKSWTLMDPTLASNNSSSAVKKYIGDGSNYTVKYSY